MSSTTSFSGPPHSLHNTARMRPPLRKRHCNRIPRSTCASDPRWPLPEAFGYPLVSMANLQPPTQPVPPNERERDLGFGTSLSRRTNLRLLNRDGSFNVKRRTPNLWSKLFSYNALITMAWWRFFLVILGVYFLINAAFAIGYRLCGPDALIGDAGVPHFLRAFFFSVHTFATIGYGNIVPNGVPANLLVTLESLVGLTAFALVAGLVFGRFSRPTARIIYSKNALISPYNGGRAFQFRIMNGRDNELLEVHASVVLGRFEENGGTRIRRFYPLNLERQ